jgi:hypothetical protein
VPILSEESSKAEVKIRLSSEIRLAHRDLERLALVAKTTALDEPKVSRRELLGSLAERLLVELF